MGQHSEKIERDGGADMVMRLRIALLILLAGLAATFARPASAQTTLNLADCSQSSLQTEWNLMSSGAYVLVFPSCAAGGTGNWTTQLSLSAPPTAVTSVTLEGQTTVSCTGTPDTSSYACTATDTTVIEDSYQAECCSNQLLLINTGSQSSTFFRITGISFEGGNIGNVNNNKQPVIQFSGSSQNFRIDHCHFDSNTYTPSGGMAWARTISDIRGVLDHNVVDLGNDSSVSNGFQADGAIDDSIGQGDGGWAMPTNWGSSAFLFIEDNVFTGGAPNDCANAGRYVMRYNTINEAYVGVQDHATKTSAGTQRGCRAQEIYKNYFTGSPTIGTGLSAIGLKGATALIWGNTLAAGYNELLDVQTDRNSGATTESQPPNGWGYCGTNNPNNSGHVTTAWDGNNPPTTGWPCLDGIGRGYDVQSLNGSGSFASRFNSVTGTVAWPQQYLEPVYVWMSTITNGGANTIIGGSDTDLENNRDFYYDNSSCAGSGCSSLTTGTGYGTLAQRPTTCTAGPGGTYATSPTGSYGVAYWATDANTLYVCTATNTWTAIYTPYTYPHPLQSGGGGGGGSVTLGPSTQNFGSVNVGSSSANVTFTVNNEASSSMTSVTVALTGTNASYFSNTGGGTCGSSLASTASCTIVVKFSPGAAGVGFSANLQVSYSGGDGNGSVSSGLTGTGISSCTSPITVNSYTVCSAAFAEASSPNTTVSIPFSPYGGNSVELFVEWCVVGCNADATQTITVSDNVNSPETCFVRAPHSPYQVANTDVPDYPIVYAYFCPIIPSGVTQLTATVSGSVDFLSINAQEIKAGQIASSGYFESVDQTQNSGATANTTASVSTSGATANAADLNTALIVNCGGSISATPGTGYTGITVNPSGDPGWVLEDMGVTTSGTQTATATWSSGTASGNCALGASSPNTTWWGVIVPLKGASGTPTLNPPVISPSPGAYSSPTVITITGPSGATLCYRTDGIAPIAPTAGTCGSGSTTYTAPFGLTIPSGGATVEAIATESGYTNSSVTSNGYTLSACSNTSLSAGWTCVTSVGNSTGSDGTSLSLGPFPVNPPIGALIVVTGFNESNAGCATPTDSLVPNGNWHQFTTATVAADSLQLCGYWGVTTSTGADTVTWNAASSAAGMGGGATVYTAPSTITLDKTCSNSNATSGSGSNNAACSSSYTNAGANELNVFVSYGDYSATVTAGTNYTLVNAAASLRDEYYEQASSGPITPVETIGSTLSYGAMGASFEVGAAPAPPAPPTALMVTPD